MNAKSPLGSPLLCTRLSSPYTGLFVVKLYTAQAHTDTSCALCFLWPLTWVERQEREVLYSRAKECVYDRCRAFFCHPKHVHSPLSLWFFATAWAGYGSLGPCPAQCWPTSTLLQLCFKQKQHLVQNGLPEIKHTPLQTWEHHYMRILWSTSLNCKSNQAPFYKPAEKHADCSMYAPKKQQNYKHKFKCVT